jgi:hypothetical protein
VDCRKNRCRRPTGRTKPARRDGLIRAVRAPRRPLRGGNAITGAAKQQLALVPQRRPCMEMTVLLHRYPLLPKYPFVRYPTPLFVQWTTGAAPCVHTGGTLTAAQPACSSLSIRLHRLPLRINYCGHTRRRHITCTRWKPYLL